MIPRVVTYCFGWLILLIYLATSLAQVEAVFDQTNTELPLGTLSQNASSFSPFGQSFTPTLTSLNFVNLLTEGRAIVQVNIRLGSISGPILGTSQPTVISFSIAPSVSIFRFSTPVTLTAGDLYVIEPFVVCGDTFIVSTKTNNYVRGNQILGGIAQANNDLWFQEGISRPEPGAILPRGGQAPRRWPLLGTGLLELVTIFFFKNRSILHMPSPD